MEKILVIEDEKNIRKLICYDVKQAGFDVYEASDGHEAQEMVKRHHFDVILIDWMLPKMNGLELLHYFRKENITGIFIMLTAKDEEENILEAFEAGANDYITKPFSPRILIARIHAHLRKNENHKSLQFGDLTVDPKRRKIYVGKQEMQLTKKEYELLNYYIMNANIVLSRDQILNDIWGFDYDGDTRIVDVHTFKIRNKLKESKVQITSNRGIGYILEEN